MSEGERILLAEAVSRFWARVEKIDDAASCWFWTGSKNKDGYGHFRVDGQLLGAHQFAFMLANGGAKPGGETCHSCDGNYLPGDVAYRACVRNDGARSHLYDGTHAENVRDCIRNGRGNRASGDRNGSRVHRERMPRGDQHPARLHPERIARGERIATHRLTTATVAEIRTRYADGGVFQRELAEQYGVHLATINRVLGGKTWAT